MRAITERTSLSLTEIEIVKFRIPNGEVIPSWTDDSSRARPFEHFRFRVLSLADYQRVFYEHDVLFKNLVIRKGPLNSGQYVVCNFKAMPFNGSHLLGDGACPKIFPADKVVEAGRN